MLDREVGFARNNGHRQPSLSGPKSAKGRPQSLFDHLVSRSQQWWRHRQAEALCGFHIDNEFEFAWAVR